MKKRIPDKLLLRYVGPLEISRRISETTYEGLFMKICHAIGQPMTVSLAHTCQLKPWCLPASEIDFVEVVKEDPTLEEVSVEDKVVPLRGRPTNH